MISTFVSWMQLVKCTIKPYPILPIASGYHPILALLVDRLLLWRVSIGKQVLKHAYRYHIMILPSRIVCWQHRWHVYVWVALKSRVLKKPFVSSIWVRFAIISWDQHNASALRTSSTLPSLSASKFQYSLSQYEWGRQEDCCYIAMGIVVAVVWVYFVVVEKETHWVMWTTWCETIVRREQKQGINNDGLDKESSNDKGSRGVG